MLIQVKATPVDFPRLITELIAGGFSFSSMAACTGIPKSTIESWRDGTEPSHSRGARFICLWAAVHLKQPSDAPTIKTPRKRPTYRASKSIQLSLFQDN
ncbi:hypothetical protein [Herbaspirillum sp. CAH-3]|uniref:hypothetical protein n=1 Tax=Herbaspirillum sp. CAH-3 TaxID=2605746 RepID=UPI0012AD0B77|nr:hypothetical protein [Herbaspirillum sp. CAH-3]MRT30805.1 hypothetical protein [Herbaspirillum sp. CAH-3]